MKRPRITIRSTMIVVAIVGVMMAGIALVLRYTANILTVDNRSGQKIASLRITVTGSDSSVLFRDVSDGEVVSSPFHIGGDGGFEMSGNLADGTTLNGGFGYVTNGMYRERVRFIIKKGGAIEFLD